MRRFRPIFCIAIVVCATTNFAWAERVLELVGDDAELRGMLEATSVLLRNDETPTSDTVAAARAEYGRLLAVLYDQGYFAGTISIEIDGREAAQISPFSAPDRIDSIVIRVAAGAPFRLGEVAISPQAPGQVATEGFVTDAPANTGILRNATRDAIDAWRDIGHATARVSDQSITAQNRSATLDAVIEIEPGPVLRFGNLVPQGQNRMPTARVLEIAGLPTGEVFSPAELDRAANRLRRTGVFSSVALREGAVRPDGTIDIDGELVEAPLRRLGFGGEVSSVDGVTLSAYWIHRNVTGGGERLSFDAEITGIGQASGSPDFDLNATFARPATATPDTTFVTELGVEYLDEETFREFVFDGLAGVEQQISDDLVGQIGVGFRYSDISDNFSDRSVTLLTLPVGLTYDSRDLPLDATSGLYASANVAPFFVTDSSTFGGRGLLDLRGYAGLGEQNSTRLAGRLQLGTVMGGGITDLPPNFLFFSGGGGTVRGQDFRGLGAVQDGEDSGGRSFVGLSGELRQDVTDAIGLVAFYDAGYIAADALWDDSGEWHSGAGVGVRYNTALGAIRLDLAAPVSGPDPDNDVFIYIGIGQAF